MLDKDAYTRFKETILKDYPKLRLEDKFKFACHNKLECFNQCCRDVNIFLTPYDIIRMRKKLNMGSQEFLDQYTDTVILDEKGLPAVVLKMNEDDNKKCFFVSEQGCTIYEDRPWSCRMYPIGMASPNKNYTEQEEFYFVSEHDIPFCAGLKESKEWTIKEWREDQGVDIYDLKNEAYKNLILHDFFQKSNVLSPNKTGMFYMACFNLDPFRKFLFGSTFFDKFDVDDKMKEQLKTSDEALFFFGIRWLRFSIFREQTLHIKENVIEKKKDELGLMD